MPPVDSSSDSSGAFWALMVLSALVGIGLVLAVAFFLFVSVSGSPRPAPAPTSTPVAGGTDAEEARMTERGESTPTPGTPVRVIPAERSASESFSPALAAGAEWPDEAVLEPVEAESEEELSTGARELLADARQLVADDLLPSDASRALGRDVGGQLFLRLGRGEGPRGLLTFETMGDEPTFHLIRIWIEDGGGPVEDVEQLSARVREVVSDEVASELRAGEGLVAVPFDEPPPADAFTANAFLDRSGLGAVWPNLHAFASPDHLVVVVQGSEELTVPPGQ